LRRAAIADGSARGTHPAGECVVRHAPPFPDGADELVLTDQPIPVTHEMDQQFEDLWFNM